MPRGFVSGGLHITAHAIERYQERVANVSAEAAELALRSPAVELAARFGAPFVRLGSGQRVVLERGVVLTVLPVDHAPGRMGFDGDRRREMMRG